MVLSFQPCQVSCERVFSVVGAAVHQRRMKMLQQNVRDIAFLKENADLTKFIFIPNQVNKK